MEINVVIKGSNWQESDLKTLFGDEEVVFAESDELGALMNELGLFPSASQARKAGRKGPVPDGWTDKFKGNKKTFLFIWNPTS